MRRTRVLLLICWVSLHFGDFTALAINSAVWEIEEGDKYDFSARPIGVSVRKSFTITNLSGSKLVNIHLRRSLSREFSVVWTTCQDHGDLLAFQSCKVAITFQASAASAFSDSVVFTANRVPEDVLVDVTGSGQVPGTKGTVDISFGDNSDGLAKTDIGSSSEVMTSLSALDGDQLVGAGISARQFTIAKYKTDGSPDTSFNGVGSTIIDLGNSASIVRSVMQGSDNSFLMVGSSDSQFAYVRVLENGALDTSFAGTGKKTLSVTDIANVDTGEEPSADYCFSATLTSDGGSLAIGNSSWNSKHRLALVKLNSAGNPDLSFNGTGAVLQEFGQENSFGRALAIQGDGKIVVVGSALNTSYDILVTRFNSNGALDTSFNGTGYRLVNFNGGKDLASDVLIQSDGKILIVGRSLKINDTAAMVAMRLNADGTFDTGFGTGGRFETAYAAGDSMMAAIQRLSTGKYIIAWYRAMEGSSFLIQLTQLLSDGTLDASFGTGGTLTSNLRGSHDTRPPLSLQSDGKLLLGGRLVSSGDSDFAIERQW